MTKNQKLDRAETIRSKIAQLFGEDDEGDFALRKAEDAMCEYINDIN